MRTVFSAAITLLLMAGCSSEVPTAQEDSSVDIEVILAKAEFDKDRVHLPDLLEEAGQNVKKLAHVYREAVRLNHLEVQQEADERLSAIVLPQAKAATWVGTPRRLKKKVPEGSNTWQRLDAIERTLERNDPH